MRGNFTLLVLLALLEAVSVFNTGLGSPKTQKLKLLGH